jgi:hypothetical protein
MRRIMLLVTVALVMTAMMMAAMAGAALAVPPHNGHACYGANVYGFTHGEDVPEPEPVSGHPGNETAAFQQGTREELANCGANEGGGANL